MAMLGILPRDGLFKVRKKTTVNGFTLVELGADLRVQFADLASELMKIDDAEERSRQFMAMRLQVIAASLRSSKGFYLYDHNNPEHLRKLALLPSSIVDDLLSASCCMSALEWLLPPPPQEYQAPTLNP